MKKAEVKNISLNKDKTEIIITCKAKGSMYIDEPKGYGFPSLINGASIVEGINIILEHGYHAIDALKGNTEYQKLIKENDTLRDKLLKICAFENGEKVILKGLTYQKSINEGSFYKQIKPNI